MKVKFILHPTFNPPQVIVDKAPFIFQRIGWGVFEIPIEVTFKDEFNLPTLKLSHYLSFDVEGEKKVHILKLN